MIITGEKISVTGTCNYGTRSEMFSLIKQYGGVPVSTVTRNTALLIQGKPSVRHDPSLKKQCALKYGIPVLTENEFMELISGQR